MNKYKSKLAEYGKSINVKTGHRPSTEFLNAKLQNRLEAINKHYAEILREYAKLDEKIAKLDEETFDHLGPESVNLGVALDWLGVLLSPKELDQKTREGDIK